MQKAEFLLAIISHFHLRMVNLLYKALAVWQIHLYDQKWMPQYSVSFINSEHFVENYIFSFPLFAFVEYFFSQQYVITML